MIGYVAADVRGTEPAAMAALLRAAGYAAVDWTMEQFDPLADPPERLAELVAIARAEGLATPQLMVHQDYVTTDQALWGERVERTERAIDACAAAGIASIGVVTGPNLWQDGHARLGRQLDEDEAWFLALRALERALARAEDSGVTVSLEPCWGTLVRDFYRTEFALSELASPALGITLDPSHFVLSGDDIATLPTAWAERLTHVHLKDAFGRPGRAGEDFTFLLPGEGRVPWPDLLSALDAAGYDGAMCVEFEAFTLLDGPLGGDLARAAALARELVAGLMESGGGRHRPGGEPTARDGTEAERGR